MAWRQVGMRADVPLFWEERLWGKIVAEIGGVGVYMDNCAGRLFIIFEA